MKWTFTALTVAAGVALGQTAYRGGQRAREWLLSRKHHHPQTRLQHYAQGPLGVICDWLLNRAIDVVYWANDQHGIELSGRDRQKRGPRRLSLYKSEAPK